MSIGAPTSLSAPPPGPWLRYRRYLPPLLIIVLWQAASSFGLLSNRTLASPWMIARTFGELTVTGELPRHLVVSLCRVAAGLSMGVSIGIMLALITGLSRRGEDLLDASLQMLRTLPFLALVPLFILWFGIGETPKIALVALGTMFPIYLTVFSGIRGIDAKLIEAGNTLGLTQRELVRHIILPGALPAALVGFRYSLGVAWLSLVVAEQINAESGIGYLIMTARDFLRTDIILVGLIVYAALGLSADQFVRSIERSVLAWRPSFVKE